MHLMTATIRPECPRRADWLAVFGTDRIPLESPFSHEGRAPGVASAEFYKLHMPGLSAEQRARLVAFLARKFGEDPATVEALIDDPEHGVPIKADDVIVTIDAMAFL